MVWGRLGFTVSEVLLRYYCLANSVALELELLLPQRRLLLAYCWLQTWVRLEREELLLGSLHSCFRLDLLNWATLTGVLMRLFFELGTSLRWYLRWCKVLGLDGLYAGGYQLIHSLDLIHQPDAGQ